MEWLDLMEVPQFLVFTWFVISNNKNFILKKCCEAITKIVV